MNEQIEKLAEQCYETGPIGKDGWPEYSKFNYKKFAELIVRDCMEVASPNYMGTPEDSVYYVEQAIDRIAEHFGVKE